MDLLQGVKDMEEEQVAEVASEMPQGIPLPSKDELLKMLDGMSGMSENDKDELRAQILGRGPRGFGHQDVNPASSQMLILLCLLLIIALIFGKEQSLSYHSRWFI